MIDQWASSQEDDPYFCMHGKMMHILKQNYEVSQNLHKWKCSIFLLYMSYRPGQDAMDLTMIFIWSITLNLPNCEIVGYHNRRAAQPHVRLHRDRGGQGTQGKLVSMS